MAGDADFLSGFMDDYFVECDEHLATIRRLLLEMDAGIGASVPSSALEELFRSFHSIKGISGMVELRDAEMLAHHMESYLRALRHREASLSQEGIDALIAGADTLERTIAARRDAQPGPIIDQVVARLAAVVSGTGSVRPATPADAAIAATWRVCFAPSAELIARGVNVDSVRARLRAAATIVDATPTVLPQGIVFEFLLAGVDEAAIDGWRADGMTVEPAAATPDLSDNATVDGADSLPAETSSRLGASHVVRVDLARLDDLMRMIGDLVISRARLEAALDRVERHVPPVEWRVVQENSQKIERQLRDLREGVMRVRLVPVREIFRRMPFVVRDLARDSGKRVRLEVHGQETEIDKFLIERMMDPVLHLVRNAVSHGIETPEARVAAGKPPEGTLTLSAAGVGESVVLEIADDGRGIDPAAVIARARAFGMEVTDGPLGPAALLDILCAPGFSTRDESDRVSGRGVGMDVVKKTVEDLNGTIELQSVQGEGTRWVIELPLTLSITDALIAHVGDRTFAVPQASVREVVEIDPAAIRQIEQHEIVPFRGGMLPILRLAHVFGIAPRPRRGLHVFVFGAGQDAVGIAVDKIAGQREIVVRSMADSLIKVAGVAGATDLGDGRVVLILDLAALSRAARSRATRLLDKENA